MKKVTKKKKNLALKAIDVKGIELKDEYYQSNGDEDMYITFIKLKEFLKIKIQHHKFLKQNK